MPRRGNEHIAQGIALGSRWCDNRPERAKAQEKLTAENRDRVRRREEEGNVIFCLNTYPEM